jgi:hypothetical protein
MRHNGREGSDDNCRCSEYLAPLNSPNTLYCCECVVVTIASAQSYAGVSFNDGETSVFRESGEFGSKLLEN